MTRSRAQLTFALAVAAGLAFVLAGCVEDRADSGAPPTCNPQCAGGFTCVSNQCIADRPSGDLLYAAEAYGPASKPNLLTRVEIPSLDLGSDGAHVDVMFTLPIEVSGRVLLHGSDPTSAAARVVFHRASRIPGATDYEVAASAMPGVPAGEAAFTVLLPPNLPGETFDISIYPDDGTIFTVPTGSPTPSMLAPPVTFTGQSIVAAPPAPLDLACDSAGLRGLVGTVVDGLGHPMAGMVVRAYVTPTDLMPKRILISSTGTTDESGAFQIFVPANRTDSFDIEVAPGADMVGPTLKRTHPLITNASNRDASIAYQLVPLGYPFYPAAEDFQLPVTYKDSAGGQAPATGARVLFSTTITPKMASDTVRYDVEAVVDTAGLAHAKLLPGDSANRTYAVSVLPPQTAKNQSVWDRPVVVGSAAGVLEPLVIPARVQVAGRVLDAQGQPAANVTVRPQLASTGFTAKELDRLAALNVNETATMANGAFTVYLDEDLLAKPALYDIEVVPPGGSALPQWSFDGVGIDAGTNSTLVTLAAFQLPAAALASGVVTDPDDNAVPTAEVHVYAKKAEETLWKLRTVTKADDSGAITLVLPSTP